MEKAYCPPSDNDLSSLGLVVGRATESLFEAYGLTLVARQHTPPEPSDKPTIAAIMGYASPEVTGSLLLTVAIDAVSRTLPTSDARPIDWVTELANQLLGRIKNQLLSYGVALQLSPPFVLTGSTLESEPEDGYVRFFEFRTDAGPVVVRIHAHFSDGFALRPNSGEASGLEEGELMFF